MAVAQPVWSRVDEAQHVDFVVHLAHGQLPVEGKTRITADTLSIMRRTGIYRWQLPGMDSTPQVSSVEQFAPPPAGASAAARTRWFSRHLYSYSYEAAQPPLFYLVAVPVYAAGDAAGGPLGGVYALRLLNAALLAGLAPLAALASLLVHPSGGRALATAIFPVFLPGLVLNGSAVTNDTLAALLGGVVTVLALLGVRRGWTPRLAALTGAGFGLAVLTKLTAAGLLIGLVAAFLWPLVARRATLVECLRPAVVAATATALLVAPWLALNVAVYGHPLAAREADTLLGAYFGPPSVSVHRVAASFKNGFATFWTGEPWDTMPIVRPLSGLGLLGCLVAVVGIQRIVRMPGSRATAAVVTAIAVGTGVWAFTAMLLSHIGGLLPGRYVYPAVVAIAVVLVQGVAAALAGRARYAAIAGLAVYLAIAIADLGGYAAGFTAAGHPAPVAAPAGRPVASTSSVGQVTMSVDRVAAVPAERRLFVHVSVSNRGDSSVEWSPVAMAYFPGSPGPVSAVYAEGTPQPEILAPGAAVEGWAVFEQVPVDGLSRPFRFGYLGVAAGDYRVYGDLLAPVDPGPAPR